MSNDVEDIDGNNILAQALQHQVSILLIVVMSLYF